MASTVIENIGLLATPMGFAARSGREQGESDPVLTLLLCVQLLLGLLTG